MSLGSCGLLVVVRSRAGNKQFSKRAGSNASTFLKLCVEPEGVRTVQRILSGGSPLNSLGFGKGPFEVNLLPQMEGRAIPSAQVRFRTEWRLSLGMPQGHRFLLFVEPLRSLCDSTCSLKQ